MKKKIIGYEIKEGTFKGTDFNEYMKKNNKGNCRYKYLLDNVVIHRIISEKLRNKMIYNILYSPQFNPIEYVNNELKRIILNNSPIFFFISNNRFARLGM